MIVLYAFLLVLGLGLILAAAELFTNAIEWVGHKLDLAEGAVGSVLAAVGTALPETMIPVVAFVFFTQNGVGHAVGTGAILGAPFMLATLAMFVTGTGVLIFARRRGRSTRMKISHRVVSQDVIFFLVAYMVAIGAAFLPSHWMKVAVALCLLLAYGIYVIRHLTAESEGGDPDGLRPLHLSRWAFRAHGKLSSKDPADIELIYYDGGGRAPRLRVSVTQVVVALVVMLIGAQLFVKYVQEIAGVLRTPALILSLLIAPIATELPEKFNSILWVRQGKDTLAIGNITGAMVFQSCVPVALGMLFTSWSVTPESTGAFLSAGIAVISSILIFGIMLLRRRLTAAVLLIGGLCYTAYVVVLFALFMN